MHTRLTLATISNNELLKVEYTQRLHVAVVVAEMIIATISGSWLTVALLRLKTD